MGVIVAFSYTTFITRYPQFVTVDPALVQLYFDEATIYHANNGAGPVADATTQLTLLNMLTAHICQLNAPQVGNPNQTGSPQLVGAIQSASEGSVSVSVKNDYPPGSPQWFQQTSFGSAYWAATAQYRTMRYRPGFGRITSPLFNR